MKKTYPKVPRHDHDSISSEFYSADDLALLEKVDGSNARLCLYDERYADEYGDKILAQEPNDGDVFIGSKGLLRGRLSDPVEAFDGAFSRLIRGLRDTVEPESLRELHTQYDSPLLLFGEHMVKHTLDYGYDESPPPVFLGFDVFRLTDYTEPPSYPFDERFEGFLTLQDSRDVFEQVGLETTPVLSRPDSLNPDDIAVPLSAFGPVQAEGVVIRSDSFNRRVKYVTEQFKERQTSAWGLREDQAESGAELFTARYLPNPRFRKTVRKLLFRDGEDGFSSEDVAEAAVADAWEEELYEIQNISIEVNPQDVYALAIERADSVLETMRTNARLNETTLDGLWQNVGAIEDGDTQPRTFSSVDSDAWESELDAAEKTEQKLASLLLSEETVHDVAESLAAERDREFGRWVIQPAFDECRNRVWYENIERLASLSVPYTPSEVNSELLDLVREVLEARDDVDTTEKPETWDPDSEEMDATGFDLL